MLLTLIPEAPKIGTGWETGTVCIGCWIIVVGCGANWIGCWETWTGWIVWTGWTVWIGCTDWYTGTLLWTIYGPRYTGGFGKIVDWTGCTGMYW